MCALKDIIKYFPIILFNALLFLFPFPASANAGLPMIIIFWPLLFILFLPIIIIEYGVMKKYTRSFSATAPLFWPLVIANLFSTLIGIPLTWIALVGIEVGVSLFLPSGGVTLSYIWPLTAPWLYPDTLQHNWMIVTALLILLIPFYFISAWTEGRIMGWMTKNKENKTHIRTAMWKANFFSYLFLALFLAPWLFLKPPPIFISLSNKIVHLFLKLFF